MSLHRGGGAKRMDPRVRNSDGGTCTLTSEDNLSISYIIEDGILRTRLLGDVTPDDVRSYRTAVRSDPAARHGLLALVDCREASKLFSTADLKILAAEAVEMYRHTAVRQRCAVLVASDVAFGLARMYEVLLKDTPIDLEFFRNAEEAMSWLQADRLAEPSSR
jgi:hypothetical protein